MKIEFQAAEKSDEATYIVFDDEFPTKGIHIPQKDVKNKAELLVEVEKKKVKLRTKKAKDIKDKEDYDKIKKEVDENA